MPLSRCLGHPASQGVHRTPGKIVGRPQSTQRWVSNTEPRGVSSLMPYCAMHRRIRGTRHLHTLSQNPVPRTVRLSSLHCSIFPQCIRSCRSSTRDLLSRSAVAENQSVVFWTGTARYPHRTTREVLVRSNHTPPVQSGSALGGCLTCLWAGECGRRGAGLEGARPRPGGCQAREWSSCARHAAAMASAIREYDTTGLHNIALNAVLTSCSTAARLYV